MGAGRKSNAKKTLLYDQTRLNQFGEPKQELKGFSRLSCEFTFSYSCYNEWNMQVASVEGLWSGSVAWFFCLKERRSCFPIVLCPKLPRPMAVEAPICFIESHTSTRYAGGDEYIWSVSALYYVCTSVSTEGVAFIYFFNCPGLISDWEIRDYDSEMCWDEREIRATSPYTGSVVSRQEGGALSLRIRSYFERCSENDSFNHTTSQGHYPRQFWLAYKHATIHFV